MAHIGVLARLDELRVPVDCISGTSMGAVIGAYAALGFSPAEIERLALATDWSSVIPDRPDRRSLSFRRKTDSFDNIWPFEFGLTDRGLGLQRGFLSNQVFNYTWRDPDLYTAGYDGFDALPIPFRPVATDLETGESVVLERGNLQQAVQASMAAIGAFPPVHIEDRDLIDGYLRAMVPVDAARGMGADKVIAVHVGWNPGELPPSGAWDLVTISLQAGYILTWANVEPDMAQADVSLYVSLPEVPLFDLTQAAKAVAAGRAAVDAQLEALRPLALTEEDYAAWRASVDRRVVSPPVVTGVSVTDLDHVDERTVLSRIEQAPGDTLDFSGLVRDLDRIFRLGTFETVGFSLPPEGKGRRLVVEPVEKPYLPWLLHVGGSFRMDHSNRGEIQILTRLTRLEINRLGGEVRGELALGSLHRLGMEFYQPLEYSRTLFVAPSVFLESHDEFVYEDSFQRGSFRTDSWGVQADLGLNLGRWAEVRAGLHRGRVHSRPRTGNPGVPELWEDAGALVFGLGFDHLDDLGIPRHGMTGGIQAWFADPSLGDDREYERYWAHLGGAATSGRWTVQVLAKGGDSSGDLPYYRDFFLGGMRDLTGLPFRSLNGGGFAMGGAGVLYHVAGVNLPYMPQWYLCGWVDVGNAWDRLEDAAWRDSHAGGALSIMVESLIGPVEGGYSRSTRGDDSLFLQAGIHFARPNGH
jgi:NTE family protein